MKLKAILILVTIALLCVGGGHTYMFLTNRSPKKYSVETFLKDKPPEKWVHLTGGQIMIKEVTYASTLGVGQITEVYLPLRRAGYQGDDELQILVKTKNPEMLAFVSDLRDAKSTDDAVEVVAKHTKALSQLIFTDVQGLVLEGTDIHIVDTLKLHAAYPKLAQNFTVLAEGEKPDPADVALFGLGIVLAIFIVPSQLRRKTTAAPATPPPLPPARPLPPASAGPPPIPG